MSEFDTLFKDSIIKIFEKKNVSPISIKLYARNLEKLNGDKPLKNLSFLKDIDNIKTIITKYKPNTQRNYLISICSILQTDLKTPAKTKLYNSYYELLKDSNKVLKSDEKQNEKSDTQKKNWMSWEDVLKIHNKLKLDNVYPKKKKLNKHQYSSLMQYVVLSLYVYEPPRRNLDYQLMKIVKAYTNQSDDFNYIDLKNKEFIFNKYKTVKSNYGGQIKILINNDLMDVIKMYLSHRPTTIADGDYFLVDFENQPLDKINSITKILNSIFHPKKISSSMLRHIYLSFKYGDILKEQKKDSVMMGHTVEQARDYIKL